jgi:hypothetical protein
LNGILSGLAAARRFRRVRNTLLTTGLPCMRGGTLQ